MKKEQYLGVSVSPLTYDQIINDMKTRIQAGEQSTVIAVNPEKVMTAQRDPLVKELINNSTYQIADGVGMIIASKLKKGELTERVTGVDMMGRILEMAAAENLGVFFYGAKEETVKKAKENLEAKITGLHVAGYENGYVKDQDVLLDKIRQSGAKIIFVALGSPRQELWIRENMPKLPDVKVFQGVGGSFDVYSGNVQRAPEMYRKAGLEWLYRLMKEPKRIKRQMALPKFLVAVMTSRGDRK
ncbi:WecB/TagA/CpsF family glycosyltransferase [Domibacillus epiphyticus]|uniref:N-acetylglucosaminyldiphosphoundecaprenol N-acetyl-beta-D-mannosaminyltransferase n=1 Tax=Domibacillus epiphyticus TaxID=1714355 RepID=A0A1V2A6Y2_9BACI|nr:WecB/TagA/CpsF family glycosyltransferase [Domibacillus epiphyticus]OMP66622.1 glycosyltransferase [Domibacillus epiphyticus]